MNGFGPEVRIHRFLTPKKGTQIEECEDAIAINQRRMVFAVVDGATEAFDSRGWARLFAKTWVRIDPSPLEASDFEPFVKDLGVRLHRKWSKRKLAWYAVEKSLGGSFLAFVALKCELQGDFLSWHALALGDCCLFHRKGRRICNSFPLTRSEEFGTNPILLPSLESSQRKAFNFVRHNLGSAGRGDDLLILSDAAASWFLRQHEEQITEDVELFDKLTAADDESGLVSFFEDLRSSRRIRNDDIAAIRIEIL
jgi:hypothetical protein